MEQLNTFDPAASGAIYSPKQPFSNFKSPCEHAVSESFLPFLFGDMSAEEAIPNFHQIGELVITSITYFSFLPAKNENIFFVNKLTIFVNKQFKNRLKSFDKELFENSPYRRPLKKQDTAY